jgi:hypothetical protein
MEVRRYGDKCNVKQVNTSKIVEAEVFDFREHDTLTVVFGKAIKVPMVWNGKLYEGKMAGIDFVSEGPTVKVTKTGR